MYKNIFKAVYRLLLTFGILCLLSYTMAATSQDQKKSSTLRNVVEGNNQFGTDLFTIAARDEGNLLISPLSAHAVMSMALQGAIGDTAKKMIKVLRVPNAESTAAGYNNIMRAIQEVKSVTLDIANKVYIMEKFKLKPAFKELIVNQFASEVDEMNFSENVKSANTINSWVEDKTKNKIKDLITPDALDDLTRLVLVNAVYFKGNWKEKFNTDDTKKEPFYLLNGEETKVDMMHLNGKKFFFSDDNVLDCKILELPYQGNELSMVIFLPNERNGIIQLQDKLTHTNITDVLDQLSMYNVNVALPKFKIESTIPMKRILEEMGAGIIFSDKADFSGIAENGEELKVSDVIQKTFIEVNEEGAEAAAATGMVFATYSMPPPPQQFIANHPFIFGLMVNRGALFLGRVSKI